MDTILNLYKKKRKVDQNRSKKKIFISQNYPSRKMRQQELDARRPLKAKIHDPLPKKRIRTIPKKTVKLHLDWFTACWRSTSSPGRWPQPCRWVLPASWLSARRPRTPRSPPPSWWSRIAMPEVGPFVRPVGRKIGVGLMEFFNWIA